jgi:hypothetical protein
MSPIRTPSSGTSVDDATLFAFDDVAIPFTHNLRLSMHPPRKHPANPVSPRGEPDTPDAFGSSSMGLSCEMKASSRCGTWRWTRD